MNRHYSDKCCFRPWGKRREHTLQWVLWSLFPEAPKKRQGTNLHPWIQTPVSSSSLLTPQCFVLSITAWCSATDPLLSSEKYFCPHCILPYEEENKTLFSKIKLAHHFPALILPLVLGIDRDKWGMPHFTHERSRPSEHLVMSSRSDPARAKGSLISNLGFTQQGASPLDSQPALWLADPCWGASVG